jgi:hypothetical protein
MMTPQDLVLLILDAHARPGTQPADLFVIAERALAEERERAIQAVTSQANALPADVDDGFYTGYKLAIKNALAALRP